MILGAIADGIQAANQAFQATGSAIQVGAAELVRQEQIFWGLDPTATDPVTQAKQEATFRQTKWAQELDPNVPIEVLRSIDRLGTEEEKMFVAQLLSGRIQPGINDLGFDQGGIDLSDDPEAVLEAVLERAERFRDELELYRFAAEEKGLPSSMTALGLERAADLLEQFGAHYANGGAPLDAYA